MTVTQWSVTWFMSTITPGDRGGVPSRIKDISLEQFALLPLALVPSVYVYISKGKHFFQHMLQNLSGNYLFAFSIV